MKPCVQKYTAHELLTKITKATPAMTDIINQHPKLLSLPVYKMAYQYGNPILDQGIFHVPMSDGSSQPITSPLIPKSLKNALGYQYVPLCIIAKKSVEAFYEGAERVMPSKLLSAGDFFGLWEQFDPPPDKFERHISLSAGARTVFLLPKISNNLFHERLVHAYGLEQTQAPRRLIDHFEVFKQIVHGINPRWACEIIVLPKEWIQPNVFKHFESSWLKKAWQQSYNTRANMSYDMAWEAFAEDMTKRNWHPRLSTVNTIKHLLAIRRGIYPGFQVTQDEEALPAECIAQTYVEIYGLKQCAPLIIQPRHLNKPGESVYYSLSLTTSLEKAIRARNTPRMIDELREIQRVMQTLLKYQPESTAEYKFFHYNDTRYNEIFPTINIPKEDPLIEKSLLSTHNKQFAYNGAFLRSCIKISLL